MRLMQCVNGCLVKFVLISPAVAPDLLMPNKQTTKAIRFCMNRLTHSPCLIPRLTKLFAITLARSFSSLQEICSPSQRSAGASGRTLACTSTSLAMQSRLSSGGDFSRAALSNIFKSSKKLPTFPMEHLYD